MKNTGITYTSAERSPVILPEMYGEKGSFPAIQTSVVESYRTCGAIMES